jgi:uncharacterized protein
MARFIVRCVKPITNEPIDFWYDNMTSQIFDADDKEMDFSKGVAAKTFDPVETVSKDTPLGKSHEIKRLKIQLGLSCNYECTYCNQRFVPKADETTKDDVEPFLTQLPTWFEGGDGTDVVVEFWGGEPFVYWKSLKPLAEGIRKMYPKIKFTMITNGTLLDEEKNVWLDELDFNIGISHDGPGYHVRGLDPFDDPEKLHNIIDLWTRLNPKRSISFNAMLNKNNLSRAAISAWFKEKLGFDTLIGEGAFIDPYDEGGASVCLTDPAEHIESRSNSFKELRAGLGTNLDVTQRKIKGFIESIKNKQPASSIGQKCGMDKKDNIAVDLKGNVLTCQNVSAIATSFNGESHLLGNVTDFDNIKLKTSTHWSHREECPKCPVLQICQGSCMFLNGPMWELGCDNAYSDNIPFFLAAWEMLTGAVPYYIEGPQREDRQDILGIVNGIPKSKKVINIKVV